MVLPCSTFCPEGPTVMVVNTGFTKNPLQPAAKPRRVTTASAAMTWNVRFTVDITKNPRGVALPADSRAKADCSRTDPKHLAFRHGPLAHYLRPLAVASQLPN